MSSDVWSELEYGEEGCREDGGEMKDDADFVSRELGVPDNVRSSAFQVHAGDRGTGVVESRIRTSRGIALHGKQASLEGQVDQDDQPLTSSTLRAQLRSDHQHLDRSAH
jgi:hypothetical protein